MSPHAATRTAVGAHAIRSDRIRGDGDRVFVDSGLALTGRRFLGLFLGVLVAVLALALGASVSTSAQPLPNLQGDASNFRVCGEARTGWEVRAGRKPRTTCRFAWATHRKARAKQRRASLPWRFRLRVRGQTLRCFTRRDPTWNITCRNPRRLVLLISVR
jgi:hypothetical protein